MSKKPASLTSELLVKKGEALPSSLDPDARASAPEMVGASAAPQEQAPANSEPDARGTGEAGHASPSSVLLSEEDSEAPRRPEPDVVMETDDPAQNTDRTRRFVLGALVGGAILVVAGVSMSLFSSREGGVAPVEPLLTAEEMDAMQAVPESGSRVLMDEDRSTAPVETAASTEESLAGPETALEEDPAPVRIMPIFPEDPPLAEAPAPAGDMAAEAVAAPAEAAEPAATEPVTPAPAAQAAAAAAPSAAESPAAPQNTASGLEAGLGTARPGQYLVQILSVRSEEAARGEWQRLQNRYGEILGGHTLNIQEADLGERGLYYRVRAGAFDGKAGADALCGQLKSAGQDCLVRREQ